MEQCIFSFLDPFSFQFQHLSEFGKNRFLQGGLEGLPASLCEAGFCHVHILGGIKSVELNFFVILMSFLIIFNSSVEFLSNSFILSNREHYEASKTMRWWPKHENQAEARKTQRNSNHFTVKLDYKEMLTIILWIT